MSALVIVESPAKAKTLSRILGKGYTVAASYGHVRDLPESAEEIPARLKKEPWARLGVDVESGFEPLYVVPRDKKKHLKKLKEELARADELLLATDEDREGESISWHVVETLKPEIPVRRIVFHEITDEAIHEALRQPRQIDDNLVRAQESRRIVDRLFGYQLSPVLWRRVARGLSAGRVQSVAVRLCVLRERQRRRFRVAAYWDAEAEFAEGFRARLVRIGDRRLATGQTFDPNSGELKKGSDVLWLRERREIEEHLAAWGRPWRVSSVEEKPLVRKPPPPFTTSTLQQEANRKLRFSASKTMRIAQRLYEGVEAGGDRVGLITYMRTDSLTLSKKALGDAQRVIRERYGDAFTTGPRQYKTRSKGAQEAHEAIRPSEISRHPERLKGHLSGDELKLYEMIWKRTVASQMSQARLKRTAVEITAPVASKDASDAAREGVFSATGKTIEFPGFLRVYVEGSDDPRADLADREVLLPPLAEGQELEPKMVEATPHETSPPARFTEASLVKKLEAEGIGRPSTYATIIDTIQRRGYVVKQNNALVPTFTAHAVTQLLEKHFREYVDTTFTARMEEDLDEIAEGKLDWKSHLRSFYHGEGDGEGLEKRIAKEQPRMDYPRVEIGSHPETGGPIVVKVGRWGPYLQHTITKDEKQIASLPPGEIPPADLDVETAVALLEKASRGARLLGEDPETGQPVYLAHGRYGAYVQLGETPEDRKAEKPRRASMPKGMDESRVGLEDALKWLSLPRSLGVDPATGEEVIAATGRFGPFIKRGSESRSLRADDDVYSLGLERALELLAQPKTRRRRGARKVLRELGKDGEGRAVQLLDGPYGPYLTNGELNASLPKGTAPESLTSDSAATLLAKRGKPPKRRRKRSRKS